MLNLIANNQAQPSGSDNNNNALVSPTPPPMPDMDRFTKNQEQLEMLTRLQKEQEREVQDLTGRLQPLSPHGSIPGLREGGGGGGRTGNEGDQADPMDDFDFDYFLQQPEPNMEDARKYGFYDQNSTGEGTGGTGGEGLDFDLSVPGPGDGVEDLFGDVGDGNQEEGRVKSVHTSSDEGRV